MKAQNVSLIFRHIHKVTLIEEYSPTFEHMSADSGILIQDVEDSYITGLNTVN